jgi:hypothetical protein
VAVLLPWLVALAFLVPWMDQLRERSARVARFFACPAAAAAAAVDTRDCSQVGSQSQENERKASRKAQTDSELPVDATVEKEIRTNQSEIVSLTKNLVGGGTGTQDAVRGGTVFEVHWGSTRQDHLNQKGAEKYDENDLPSLDDFRRDLDQDGTASSTPLSFAAAPSWRSAFACNCDDENGGSAAGAASFLPPGMLLKEPLRSAGAVMRMGVGGCYHRNRNR